MTTTRPESDPRTDTSKLDEALEDTFPASDPPASASLSLPLAAPEGKGCRAYLVIRESTADRPLAQWQTQGQERWTSPGAPMLHLAMSPALAMLDALASSEDGGKGDGWMLAHLDYPAAGMRRLDSPHEGWQEPTYSEDVRQHADEWCVEGRSAFLRVPSALCPQAFNLLVNLRHPDSAQLHLADVVPLTFDARLHRG